MWSQCKVGAVGSGQAGAVEPATGWGHAGAVGRRQTAAVGWGQAGTAGDSAQLEFASDYYSEQLLYLAGYEADPVPT